MSERHTAASPFFSYFSVYVFVQDIFFARFSFYFIKLCVWILDLGCVPMLLYNAIKFHRTFILFVCFFSERFYSFVSGQDSYEIENILTPYIRFFSIRLSNSFNSFFCSNSGSAGQKAENINICNLKLIRNNNWISWRLGSKCRDSEILFCRLKFHPTTNSSSLIASDANCNLSYGQKSVNHLVHGW